MNRRKKIRVRLILMGLLLLGFSTFLIGYGLKETIQFFYTPSQIIDLNFNIKKKFRVGGLVKEGSIKRNQGKKIEFILEDAENEIKVMYEGILPDLFKEKMGIIAFGFLNEKNAFQAVEVLAKHDENYLPKEIVDSMKEQGIFVKTE